MLPDYEPCVKQLFRMRIVHYLWITVVGGLQQHCHTAANLLLCLK